MTNPQPTPIPESAKVEALLSDALALFRRYQREHEAKAANFAHEDSALSAAATEKARTNKTIADRIEAHIAAQAEALAQRITDAGERERVAEAWLGWRIHASDGPATFNVWKDAMVRADRVLAILARPDAEPVKDGPHDDAREDAWTDFEGERLTDGQGYAAAGVYRRCRAQFDDAWPQGRAAAMDAAQRAFDGRTAPSAPPTPSALIKAGEVSEEMVEAAWEAFENPAIVYTARRAMDKSCWEIVEDTDPSGPISDDTIHVIERLSSSEDAEDRADELNARLGYRAALTAALTKGEGDVG